MSMTRIHTVMMTMSHFQKNSKLELRPTGPIGQHGQPVTLSALQMEIQDPNHENESVSLMTVHQLRSVRAIVMLVRTLNFVHVNQHHYHVLNGPSGDIGLVVVVRVVAELVKDNDRVCMVVVAMEKKNKFSNGKYFNPYFCTISK